jgi:hypothetical protein
LYLGSYRDPNLAETLKAIDGIPDYIRNFAADSRELTKYIIGTISEIDRHYAPEDKGLLALKNYLTGISFEKLQKKREEVLSTEVAKLNDFADYFDKVLKQNIFTVFGNENQIRKNEDLFKSLVKVFS